MLFDARAVAEGSVVEADLCIVGAGAAGITLARELAGTRTRVCLLESGGFEHDEATQELYRGRVYGRPYFTLDSTRTRRFGGSTHCWQGLCRPLDPIDFEVRSWLPHSGWPFGFEALRPYYERAQEVHRLAGFRYAAEDWAGPERPALPFASDAIETGIFQVAPHSFAALHGEEVTRAPNVDTYLYANAVEILARPDSRAVEGVQVACLTGRRFRVRARRTVLATGGIENARLLLASQGAGEAGLGNGRGLVGRFFMEHPHVIAGAFLPASRDLSLALYRPEPVGEIQVAGYLAPSDALRRRERILSFTTFLAHESGLPDFEVPLARVVQEMDGAPAPAPSALLLMNEIEQAPNPISRVRLIPERDALGLPRVQLEWRLSAIDKASIRRGHEVLARELGRAGLGRLQLTLSEDERDWPRELGGGRHHMGTTRMHEDPAQGVVDGHGRVHGFANLYVAGSSLFPTGGAANPTLTLVALAIRLADHLKESPA